MRPPSYYNTLAGHPGYSYTPTSAYSTSSSYNNRSTSQQLRSSLSSSSSSAYVTRTHLPFVSPSVLVAHCITGAGTSTRPYGQSLSPSSSRYNRQPSTKRAPSSYLSSTSYTPRSSTSYLSSSGRSGTGSSYNEPIRLRQRPLLSQLSRQLKQSTLADEGQSKDLRSSKLTPDTNSDKSWSTDVARNISRNKYLIKFREFDKRKSLEPPNAQVVESQRPASELCRCPSREAKPDPGQICQVEDDKLKSEPEASSLPQPELDTMRIPQASIEPEIRLTEVDKKAPPQLTDEQAPESTAKPKEKRQIKLKVKNLKEVQRDIEAGKCETRVKRTLKKKSPSDSKSPDEDETKNRLEPKAEALKDEKSINDGAPLAAKQVQRPELTQKVSKSTSGHTLNDTTEDLSAKRIRFREYHIDDFNFLTVLGHGGWGFVILAELKQHDTFFAVKCIKKITIVEDDDFDSIMIERKVLSLGNLHPFICKLFCTFETEGYLFFAMEYCAGGDLMFHVQREGKFDEARCRFYAAEIICAIRFLHNRHIIYRDLKLDNILLDAVGHVRLVDFGMCQCRTYREELLPSNFCGTPEYISPEIIKGVPYNHSVDWWSFGVLLYEMAVGKMPFRGSDENELLWNVCYEQIHYPMFLSKNLAKLLQQLLERDPNKRMGMATCKAGDIYEQAWFAGLDWEAVEQLRVKPPFVPQVPQKNSKQDVQNFDADFTQSTPELSPVDEQTLERIDQEQFQGFPYTNPNIFIFE